MGGVPRRGVFFCQKSKFPQQINILALKNGFKKVEIEGVRPLWLDSHRNSAPEPGLDVSRSFFSTHLVKIWCHVCRIGVPGPACTVLGPNGEGVPKLKSLIFLSMLRVGGEICDFP